MSPCRAPRAAACLALATVLVACGGSGGGGGGFGGESIPVELAPAFGGQEFTRPVKLVQHPELDDRWYVVEQGGLVRTFLASDVTGSLAVAADLTGVDFGGDNEQGLLALAFDPDFDTTDGGELYLVYTDDAAERVLLERWTSDNGVDDFAPAASPILLDIDHPEGNHNGSDLVFGPDDQLYMSMGDGGGAGDPEENAQDTTTVLGAVLRLDVRSTPAPGEPYAVPAGNPFAGQGHALCFDGGASPEVPPDPCPELFAWGLRNPWRMDFDPQTGDLWLGDVGQNRQEEIDRIVAGGNYGWDCLEGELDFENVPPCDPADFEPPEVVHVRTEARSITGGVVARNTSVPGLEGHYVYADFITGRFWTFDVDDPDAPVIPLDLPSPNVSDFERARDGTIYVVTFGDPSIRQLVAPPPP